MRPPSCRVTILRAKPAMASLFSIPDASTNEHAGFCSNTLVSLLIFMMAVG